VDTFGLETPAVLHRSFTMLITALDVSPDRDMIVTGKIKARQLPTNCP